jgi:hypothetical protein
VVPVEGPFVQVSGSCQVMGTVKGEMELDPGAVRVYWVPAVRAGVVNNNMRRGSLLSRVYSPTADRLR